MQIALYICLLSGTAFASMNGTDDPIADNRPSRTPRRVSGTAMPRNVFPITTFRPISAEPHNVIPVPSSDDKNHASGSSSSSMIDESLPPKNTEISVEDDSLVREDSEVAEPKNYSGKTADSESSHGGVKPIIVESKNQLSVSTPDEDKNHESALSMNAFLSSLTSTERSVADGSLLTDSKIAESKNLSGDSSDTFTIVRNTNV